VLGAWLAVRFQEPNPRVLGVLPVVVFSEHLGPRDEPGGSRMTFRDYQLFLVAKVQNDGPSPATVGVVWIRGCAALPLGVAQTLFNQPQDGRDVLEVEEEAHRLWGRARQRIATTGSPLAQQKIDSFSTDYVVARMSLPIQWAAFASEDLRATVAVDGNCAAPGVAENPDPSAFQLFELGQYRDSSGTHPRPERLMQDFTTGALRIELQLGNDMVGAEPATLRPLKAVSAKFWETTRAAELYENPDSVYLPMATRSHTPNDAAARVAR
jgi:hypothetical protein